MENQCHTVIAKVINFNMRHILNKKRVFFNNFILFLSHKLHIYTYHLLSKFNFLIKISKNNDINVFFSGATFLELKRSKQLIQQK